MSIIPVVRCSNFRASVAFHTRVLDFEWVDGDREMQDPAYCFLRREGAPLCLSSHAGDGEYGQVVIVTTGDVDAVTRRYRERGLRTPGDPDAPREVHEGPLDQTWGTREFYVDDPDGNTRRFVQGLRAR